MKVTKAVIPVAGLGTRMLPATKAIPKEMLPVVDKPLIQYVVNECVEAGIKDIILITHSSKNAIENHFDKSFELEVTLEKRVKRQLLKEVQNIIPSDVSIMHVRQGETKGLAHAIKSARAIIENESFAVILPDVILNKYAYNPRVDNLSAMIRNYEQTGISQILVEKVAPAKTKDYGIVDFGDKEISLQPGESKVVYGMVEKPEPEQSPSCYAMVGRYVLTPEIWPLFDKTPLGSGGELQLTDTLRLLLKHHQINAMAITGNSIDCGAKLGYLKAIVEYAGMSPILGKEFVLFAKEFLKKHHA